MKDQNKQCCVYMHVSPSGKKYIGITSQDTKKRWQNGYGYLNKNSDGTYKQPAMARAVLKYPDWDNDWQHLILEDDLSEEEAKVAEQDAIKEYKTCDPRYGYNITAGGDGMHEWVPSEETKKRISESLKGKMSGENHPLYGKYHAEESKIKMTNSANKRWQNPAEKEKISILAKKRFESPIEREKISKTRIARGSSKGFKNPRARCIYCIELDRIFWGAKQAHDEFNVDQSAIAACCRQKYGFKSAGKHPETEEPLRWLYVDDAVVGGYITQEQLNLFYANLTESGETDVE